MRVRLRREEFELVEVLAGKGLRPFPAGGWFHPPAQDFDVFLLEPADPVGLVKELRRELKGFRVDFVLPTTRVLDVITPGGRRCQVILPRERCLPEDVLRGFDLGASQIGLWRGEILETPEHRRAVAERRPLVLQVSARTPERVIKYAGKGFPNYQQDLGLAIAALIWNLPLMTEEERRRFLAGEYGALAVKLLEAVMPLRSAIASKLLAGEGLSFPPVKRAS